MIPTLEVLEAGEDMLAVLLSIGPLLFVPAPAVAVMPAPAAVAQREGCARDSLLCLDADGRPLPDEGCRCRSKPGRRSRSRSSAARRITRAARGGHAASRAPGKGLPSDCSATLAVAVHAPLAQELSRGGAGPARTTLCPLQHPSPTHRHEDAGQQPTRLQVVTGPGA